MVTIFYISIYSQPLKMCLRTFFEKFNTILNTYDLKAKNEFEIFQALHKDHINFFFAMSEG